jgi:DNA repair protein RecN (Recombination protein N)
MLEELRIRGLGVIEDAELTLGPGLTVITGETGAGKTMLLTALGLLLGGRADPSAVRRGAGRADVEGVLHIDHVRAARAVDAGAVVEDDRLLVVRTVTAEGRSRAVLGGRSVPVGLLGELADDLVAVHGQSAHVALGRPDRQRGLLDAFGAPATLHARRAVADLHARLAAVDDELALIRGEARERAREADLLRHGLVEIEAVQPQPGEEDALAAEEDRLVHADRLREAAGLAAAVLSGDESQPEARDVLSQVAVARQALDGARSLDPALAAHADRLTDASLTLVDIAAELSGYLADLEADPYRLTAVVERRGRLTHLFRRYGQDVPAVLAWADQARERLDTLDQDADRTGELEALRARLREDLGTAAAVLTAARTEAAVRLAREVTAELRALAMPHAELTVTVRQRERPDGIPVGDRLVACTADGADQVEFLLAPHPGAAPRPLDRGASGGELSRTMLALQVVLASADPVPTLVFDEVDAGVGGRAAVEVGRRLARLGRHAQVLVVTHLPQVAAFADHHFVVHKNTAGEVTASGVRPVTDTDRAEELARMMAGLETTDVALQHARELLEVAATER